MNFLDYRYLNEIQLNKLNEFHVSLQESFHELLENFYKNYINDNFLFFNQVFSRNNYHSSIYTSLVYLVFFTEEIKLYKFENIIVPSIDIKNCLLAKYPNLNITVKNDDYIQKRFQLLRLIFISFICYSDKIFFRRKYFFNGNEILLDIFLHADSFEEDKCLNRYYGNLKDYFSPNDRNLLYLVPHITNIWDYYKISNKSKKQKSKLIFKQDFLRLIDYFNIIKKLIKTNLSINSKLTFEGHDITQIFLKEFNINKFNTGTYYALLNYVFAEKFSNFGKKIPNKFIIWYENQIIQRGLIMGFKKFHSNSIIKGYQGFNVSFDFNFYLSPTKLEERLCTVPDFIYVIGRCQLQNVKRFNNNLNVFLAPAFRYQHIWFHEKYDIKKDLNFTVLFLLPFTKRESLVLLNFIKEIVLYFKTFPIEFRVRLHPDLKNSELLNYIKNLDLNLSISGGSIYKDFVQSNLVMGNTTSSLNEALQFCKVFVIGNQIGFTQNPIPKNIPKSNWAIGYSFESAIKYILSCFNDNNITCMNIELIESLFQKPTVNSARHLINKW